MDIPTVEKAVKSLKEGSQKRQFTQSVDLVLNLKDIDLKKQENQIDTFATLHFSKGKPVKVCGLVGPELKDESNANFEKTITVDDFDKYAKDKKAVKKLAEEFDFFVAQGTIMAKVAGAFGRVLGSRGKMPNPKVGCVVPPNANLKPLSERLHKVVRLRVKNKQGVIQAVVGNESMPDKEIADNIVTVYNTLIHALPSEKNNIKNRFIKLTMGKPVEISDNGDIVNKTNEAEGSAEKSE